MDLARRIEHTLLQPQATRPEIHRVVAEATEYGFAAVCTSGIFTADVAAMLRGNLVRTCCVAGFPLGANKVTVKAIEATAAAKDGADEIDFVAHLPYLLKEDVASAKAEFMEIVKAVRSVNREIVVKVIVETAALMDGVDPSVAESRIEAACRAARESGCDFVKTSTGFHRCGGATVDAVKLLKQHAGGLSVKAAGGIGTCDDALRMIEAGADRLGCSAGVSIVKQSRALR